MKNIRDEWIEKHRVFQEIAEAEKDSQGVPFKLMKLYDSLSDAEKESVNELLGEWLTSDDEDLRYDAAFLISQRTIRSLKPVVERAIDTLQTYSGVGIKFEIEKLHRIIQDLCK